MSNFLAPRFESMLSRQDVFGNMETLFNDVFDGMLSKKSTIKGTNYPRMDMFERDNKFYIQLACAGLSEDEVQISVSEQQETFGTTSKYVTISGDKLDNYENADFYIKGLTRSSFNKTIKLPENLKGDPVATMTNGLLTVSWEFSTPEETKTVKKITINKGKQDVIAGTTCDLSQPGPDLTRQKQKK